MCRASRDHLKGRQKMSAFQGGGGLFASSVKEEKAACEPVCSVGECAFVFPDEEQRK